MPPLHPILVNFTAALVPASLVSDVLGRVLRRQSLTSAGWWMLLYASVITPFTVVAGWLWLRQMEGMNMPGMAVHQWLGTALALVFIGLVFWRWRIHRRPDGMPSGLYLICTAIVVAALVVQGHLGGSMSFDSTTQQEPELRKQPATSPASQNIQDKHQDGEWRDHIDVP